MGTEAQVKFEIKRVGIKEHPVLIIGQNPGRQRQGEQTNIVWEGNRSSDLLRWVLSGHTNYILTNVCNYREITPDRVLEGLEDINALIRKYRPYKIICLGGYSHVAISNLDDVDYYEIQVIKLPHPSWIARFNKDREKYKKLFTSHLFHV